MKPLKEFRPDLRCEDNRRSVCLRCNAIAGRIHAAGDFDLETADHLLPQNSAAREQRISLGIAIAHATCAPGQRRTLDEIAAYAGASAETIRLIEEQALCKVRREFAKVLRHLDLTPEEVKL
jgi:hypothetical protein